MRGEDSTTRWEGFLLAYELKADAGAVCHHLFFFCGISFSQFMAMISLLWGGFLSLPRIAVLETDATLICYFLPHVLCAARIVALRWKPRTVPSRFPINLTLLDGCDFPPDPTEPTVDRRTFQPSGHVPICGYDFLRVGRVFVPVKDYGNLKFDAAVRIILARACLAHLICSHNTSHETVPARFCIA
jgi:hypothetical protein